MKGVHAFKTDYNEHIFLFFSFACQTIITDGCQNALSMRMKMKTGNIYVYF